MSWLPKKTVLVPVDFSEHSLAAVETALDCAEGPASLHLVHVLGHLHPAEPGVVFDVASLEDRRARIQALVDERLGAKVDGCAVHLPVGSPGAEIIRVAERIEAELIVMPSHGRTGLARLTLGSVAERVVRHAHCPVLVLRN